MDGRLEMLKGFYGSVSEDERLGRSRHGQLEYITTMNYIHRFLPEKKEKADIIELGAGTGRYSAALAGEGHSVTAVELVESNLEILRQKSADLGNLKVCQGDAIDLGQFADASFDLTLVLGPMYHLYDRDDVCGAIDEAVRITRTGGVIITAFLSVHAIIYNNYLDGSLRAGIDENFAGDYSTIHFTEQLFTGYDIDEFEALYWGRPLTHIVTASADSVLELAENREDFTMSDEDFRLFADYHLAVCEKRELLGASSHLLHICRRD